MHLKNNPPSYLTTKNHNFLMGQTVRI